jgi:hypothetical protein
MPYRRRGRSALMPGVEVQIDPEPSAEERAAILAALEQEGTFAAEPAPHWGRPELGQERTDPPTGV